MPKVGEIEQYGGPKVRSQVEKGTRAQSLPASAFGGQIGEALGSASDQVYRAQQHFMQRRDEVDAEAALVAYEKEANDLLFNPETGYYSRQGQDAFDSAEETQRRLEELRVKHADALQSTGSRNLFDRTSKNQNVRRQRNIMGHAQKGFQAYEAATRTAAIENTLENAHLLWADPNELRVQRELGKSHKIDELDAQGIYGSARAEALESYESVFNKTSIKAALASKDVAAAKKMAEDMHLEGPDRLELEGLIHDAEVLQESNRLVNELFGDGSNDHGDVMDAARAIKDPEVRDNVITEVTQLRRAYDLSTKRTNEKTVSELSNQIAEEGATLSQVKEDPRWAALPHKAKQQVRDLASGKGKVSDIEFRDRLMSDITSRTPRQVADIDLVEVREKLDDSDYEKVEKVVLAARKGDMGPAMSESKQTEKRNATLKRLNLKKESAAGLAFIKQFDLMVYQAQQNMPGGEKDRVPTETIDEILTELTRKVVEPDGGFWNLDSEHMVYKMKSMPVVDVDEIPKPKLRDIKAYLKDRGYKVNDNNIAMVYQQELIDAEHE